MCVPSLTELMTYDVCHLNTNPIQGNSVLVYVSHVNFVLLILVLWWNVPDIHSQVMTYKINYCQHFFNYGSAHSGVAFFMMSGL